MLSRLDQPSYIDFSRHNEEVRQVWASYDAGRPLRVPFGRLDITPRVWMQDPRLNSEGISWESFSTDPAVMFETVLKYRYYAAHNIVCDMEMGIPEKHWEIQTEFNNVYEQAWLGCPVIYLEGQVPATTPRYVHGRAEELLERGIPGPFDGFMDRVRSFYEYFVDRVSDFEFCGRPVRILPPVAAGTDGPLTVAVGVCGHEILEAMVADEDTYHRVMTFITDAIIARIKGWRAYLGMERPDSWGFPEDAIQFISVRAYRENVLPYHRRLVSELAGSGPHFMHLCGNVQRHLPTLVRELNVRSFETGFPIDFTTLRGQLGEDVEVWGGVHVGDLLALPAQKIYDRSVAILQSGIMRGGKFILKEASNLPPMTPPENLAAMYAATKEHGVYER